MPDGLAPDDAAERHRLLAQADAAGRPPAPDAAGQAEAAEDHALLRDLSRRRAGIRRLHADAFRTRSLSRWAALVLRDRAGSAFSGYQLWERHPHVRHRDQLSFGERAADVMRNSFGSWTFVGTFLTFMGAWMVLNTVVLGPGAFDKYPWILLNLMLSMMAGLQGALILIAAKRADRVQAEQATAHYAETQKLDTLQTQNNEMTSRIEAATSLLAEIHRQVSALSPQAGESPPGTAPPGLTDPGALIPPGPAAPDG